MLFAGIPDDLEAKVPQAENLNAFPTPLPSPRTAATLARNREVPRTTACPPG